MLEGKRFCNMNQNGGAHGRRTHARRFCSTRNSEKSKQARRSLPPLVNDQLSCRSTGRDDMPGSRVEICTCLYLIPRIDPSVLLRESSDPTLGALWSVCVAFFLLLLSFSLVLSFSSYVATWGSVSQRWSRVIYSGNSTVGSNPSSLFD